MPLPFDWLAPDWPAPSNVKSCVTTVSGGLSQGPYASFNLGDHVGDDKMAVAHNRQFLAQQLHCQPTWLEQVHGTAVADAVTHMRCTADASITQQKGIACCVMTADCLPVLFCDQQGTQVAAAHAGWRGLAGGMLEQTVKQFTTAPDQLMAWLGPAISQAAFEVGLQVRDAFMSQHLEAEQAFVPSVNQGKWMADLYQLARIRLASCGVHQVYGGGECTYYDQRFYSYRRNSVTGRFASLIWLD
ncbi:peptidoglycan editing factor PgeF [Pseudomonas sp. F1_0610]|uniref:peptidoglycan editing factor PgeF n=1 Tax=Pseudomonas sp. F1_0610 TaxID=3114284 RepID=UPI0039C1D1EE